MATAFITAAEMQNQLGGIPLERIRMEPPPGLATEADLLRLLDSENRICELVDGVLVEKTIGYFESRLAAALIFSWRHSSIAMIWGSFSAKGERCEFSAIRSVFPTWHS